MPRCLCSDSVFRARPGLRALALPSQLSIEDPDRVGTLDPGLSGLHGVALPFQLSTFNCQLSIEDPDPVGTANSGLSSSPPTASRSHSQSFDSAGFRRL